MVIESLIYGTDNLMIFKDKSWNKSVLSLNFNLTKL